MEESVLQFYQVKGIADNKVIDLKNPESYKLYFERLQQEVQKGNGEIAMINLLDSIAVNMLLKQNNDVIIWSDQVNQLRDGYDTISYSRIIPLESWL